MSVLSADDDDAQRLESMLVNIARGLGAAPAHLEAAAGLLGDERPEPATRQLIAQALDRDANLRDRYRRQLRLLADGLPAYTDASGRPVPAQPGFGDRGPSGSRPASCRGPQPRPSAEQPCGEADEPIGADLPRESGVRGGLWGFPAAGVHQRQTPRHPSLSGKTRQVLDAVAINLPSASRTSPSAKAARRPGLVTRPVAVSSPPPCRTGRR